MRASMRARLLVFQTLQPFDEWLRAGHGLVVTKRDGHCNL
jgi:hypothetical protein